MLETYRGPLRQDEPGYSVTSMLFDYSTLPMRRLRRHQPFPPLSAILSSVTLSTSLREQFLALDSMVDQHPEAVMTGVSMLLLLKKGKKINYLFEAFYAVNFVQLDNLQEDPRIIETMTQLPERSFTRTLRELEHGYGPGTHFKDICNKSSLHLDQLGIPWTTNRDRTFSNMLTVWTHFFENHSASS